MHNRSLVISLLVACISGCATAPSKVVTLDGSPPTSDKSAIRLATGSYKTYPGNPLEVMWNAHLTKVNDKPVPTDAAYVQIQPGTYTLEYDCYSRESMADAGGGKNLTSASYDIGPPFSGKILYATFSYHTTVRQVSTNAVKTNGICQVQRITEDQPFWVGR